MSGQIDVGGGVKIGVPVLRQHYDIPITTPAGVTFNCPVVARTEADSGFLLGHTTYHALYSDEQIGSVEVPIEAASVYELQKVVFKQMGERLPMAVKRKQLELQEQRRLAREAAPVIEAVTGVN